MEDVYKTIAAASSGLYKEKGSRFIALAYPVSDEEEIRSILTGLREKYYDARHHCYAWRLGAGNPRFRANDDGEPSSTAGKPILGQIQSAGLTNILVVVVRYFGGIKLGVPGLINAYREAAADALRQAEVVEKTVDETVHICFAYPVMNEVMKVVKDLAPEILARRFELECEMVLSIRQKDLEILRSRLLKIESVSFPDEE